MAERDHARLQDIRRYGLECLALVEGMDLAAYRADRTIRLATERLLEIVGEAAGALSEGARSSIEYDWAAVRGFRNVLAHRYGEVLPDLVWAILRKRLPELLERVSEALAKD